MSLTNGDRQGSLDLRSRHAKSYEENLRSPQAVVNLCIKKSFSLRKRAPARSVKTRMGKGVKSSSSFSLILPSEKPIKLGPLYDKAPEEA